MLKKQQWIVVSAGAVLLFVTFAFGRFSPKHEEHEDHAAETPAAVPGQPSAFDINAFIGEQKKGLTPPRSYNSAKRKMASEF